MSKKFLVIQTAFLGDVILSLPVIQNIKEQNPQAEIHFLVRSSAQNLVAHHKDIDQVWTWDKKNNKYKQLNALIKSLRKITFDEVINLHRHSSMGWLTARMKAPIKKGFEESTFKWGLTHKVPYATKGESLHETERYLKLVDNWTSNKPIIHWSQKEEEKIVQLTSSTPHYYVVSPGTVWATKQWPIEKWKALMLRLPIKATVYVNGGPNEKHLGETLATTRPNVVNLCGKISLIESALLMKGAIQSFVHDSAPMHLASAINAKVTAIFCSTSPTQGFGPLSESATIIETPLDLECKPCGPHGHQKCPKRHFKCGKTILSRAVYSPIHFKEDTLSFYSEQENTLLALAHLNEGNVILHNTDTVPGLASKAINPAAIEKIYSVKQRSKDKPLLMLCSDMRMVKDYVNQVPSHVFELIDQYHDQPLTIIYPFSKNLPDNINGENGSIGIRIPQNDDLRALIAQLGCPIASTSANLSGEPTPLNLDEVHTSIASKVDFIHPHKTDASTQPSTIVELTADGWEVLR